MQLKQIFGPSYFVRALSKLIASLKSVRNCAQTLIDTEGKINILVNNAGEILLEINLLKAFKLELTGHIKQLTYLENKISFLEPPTSLRMVILLD